MLRSALARTELRVQQAWLVQERGPRLHGVATRASRGESYSTIAGGEMPAVHDGLLAGPAAGNDAGKAILVDEIGWRTDDRLQHRHIDVLSLAGGALVQQGCHGGDHGVTRRYDLHLFQGGAHGWAVCQA